MFGRARKRHEALVELTDQRYNHLRDMLCRAYEVRARDRDEIVQRQGEILQKIQDERGAHFQEIRESENFLQTAIFTKIDEEFAKLRAEIPNLIKATIAEHND